MEGPYGPAPTAGPEGGPWRGNLVKNNNQNRLRGKKKKKRDVAARWVQRQKPACAAGVSAAAPRPPRSRPRERRRCRPHSPRAAGSRFPPAAAVGAAGPALPEPTRDRLPGAARNRGTKQKVSQKNPPRSPVNISPCLVSEGNPRGRKRVFVRRDRGRWFSAPRRCGDAQRSPGRAVPQPPATGVRRGPGTGGRHPLPQAGPGNLRK